MRHTLYPPGKYPDGHPELATSLNNVGFVLRARGEYGLAEPFFSDALAMRQQLYPKEKYPDGHPDLAQSLNNVGFLLEARGEYGRAEPFYQGALAMTQRLIASFADASAEAEALNLLRVQLPQARDFYLSASANLLRGLRRRRLRRPLAGQGRPGPRPGTPPTPPPPKR
jgi:tetratricopeptide (TPR) repeat protein